MESIVLGGKLQASDSIRLHDDSRTEMLVTTNDSRIRAISMADFSLSMKFKGATNTQMQIFGRYCSLFCH